MLANKANGYSPVDNTSGLATWTNMIGNSYTASLKNFNYNDSSGWIGNGENKNPHRLIFDGLDDYVITNYSLDYTKEFSIHSKVKIPSSGTGSYVIYGSDGNSTGTWLHYLYFDLSNKSFSIGIAVYGGSQPDIVSPPNLFDYDDVVDVILVHKINKVIELWVNGVKVIDSTYDTSPRIKPVLTLASNIPSSPYKSFFRPEVMAIAVYDTVLTTEEIIKNCASTYFLIKQDSLYYCINPSYYNHITKKYNCVILNGVTEPNLLDFETFGFNELGDLTLDMDISGEIIKPIDALENKFKIIVCKN